VIARYYTAEEAALLDQPRECDLPGCGKTSGLTIWLRYRVIRCDKHPPSEKDSRSYE
jgi:hypothetical protein